MKTKHERIMARYAKHGYVEGYEEAWLVNSLTQAKEIIEDMSCECYDEYDKRVQICPRCAWLDRMKGGKDGEFRKDGQTRSDRSTD